MLLRPYFVVASSLLLAAVVSAGPLRAEPRTYTIDKDHLAIAFLVTHIGYAKTLGTFREASGSFKFDEESLELKDIKVVVKTASVFTDHKKRDDHLRSDQFLDVDSHPEMTFVGTSAEKTGERSGKVTGDLTLRGQTHPLTLDVTWNKSDTYPFGHGLYTIGISARGTVKRSLYGMSYAVANGFVGDDVELIIEFEANRR